MINYSPLKDLLPVKVFDELLEVSTRFMMNTPKRIAHFLSQCAHESGNFKYTEENLNYSTERLLQVFPKYFSKDNVNAYARNPKAIASRVYANRMGNGNEESMEGWLYRGRGYLQLTGKDNYGRFDSVVPESILESPDLVATKYPLLTAGYFWDFRCMNNLADKECVECITRAVNGGLNGLEDRKKQYDKFYGVLNA